MKAADEVPIISVIIVTYNGKKYIDKLLASLVEAIKFYNNVEVIIVDNHSSDGTFELARSYIPFFANKLKLFRLNKNLQYSGGNSVGFELSRGRLILFLNQDTYVDPNLLKNIAHFFKENPQVGVAQCLLLQYRYPSHIDSLGDILSSIGVGAMNHFGEKLENIQNTVGINNEICMARGAAMVIRRNLLNISKIINGSSIPKYFVAGGYEDWYLSLLTRSLGYKVALIFDCKVYHDSLRQKHRDHYDLYGALNLFVVLRAPLTMMLGRILVSIISVFATRTPPLKLLHAITAFLKNLKSRLRERYIFYRIMTKRGIKSEDLWKPKMGSTKWLRWYINYLRLTNSKCKF